MFDVSCGDTCFSSLFGSRRAGVTLDGFFRGSRTKVLPVFVVLVSCLMYVLNILGSHTAP